MSFFIFFIMTDFYIYFFFICSALLDCSSGKEDYSFSINTGHLSTVPYQDKKKKAKQLVIEATIYLLM